MKLNRMTVTGMIAIGALAIASTWLGIEYRTDINHARARVSAGSRVVATRCGPIEYAEAGSGPAILIIHGAGGGFDQGMALAESFAPKGHRVIAMSRFGYLRTPVPNAASVVQQADAHACLLDALGITSAIAIGVSAGAPSALEFALRHADRCTALVLVAPGWFPTLAGAPRRLTPTTQFLFERAMRSDFAFWMFARFFPNAATRGVLGTPPNILATASNAEKARVASVLSDILPVSQRSEGLVLEAKFTTEQLSMPLSMVRAPTLVISAKDDLYGTWGNATYIAHGIPHARFIEFPTGGHMLVGHAEEIRESLAEFLEQDHN